MANSTMPVADRTQAHAKRLDIQGLRAVAVALVALNHAGLPGVPGGFVGVDVFYVVSGFVITGSLLGLENRHGISIAAFYAARARRILPMSTLVLITTVLASWKLLDFTRAHRVTDDAAWAGLFSANFHFASTNTDYFASDLPQSPLQHYWSLAVEEQFYVVWPLLLGVLIFGVTARSRRHAARKPLPANRILAVLGVIIVVSLGWSIKQTAQLPTVAFFSTFTRAWELAIGAALAVGSGYLKRIPRREQVILSWTGLAGIVLAALVITSGTPFPGYAALLPVLSTAAVIAGGTGHAARGAEWVLRRRPFQAVGDVSFSFYLWHWPILIIAEGHAGHPLSLSTRLLLLAAALALSFGTYRAVETPFRTAQWFAQSRGNSLSLWPLAICALVFTCVPVSQSINDATEARIIALSSPDGAAPTPKAASQTPAVVEAEVRASVALAEKSAPIPTGLSPNIEVANKDFDTPYDCISQPPTTTNNICSFGDTGAKRTIVIAGDSHAMQWIPALDAIGQARHWRIVPMIKIYCVSALRPGGMNAAEAKECASWQQWMIKQVNGMHPSQVLLANFMQGNHPDSWQTGLTAAAKALSAPGTTVTILSDPPGLSGDPSTCLLSAHASMATCTTKLAPMRERMRAAARAAATASGAKFADLDPYFCSDGRCPAVIGHTIAYMDFQHVSKTYSLQLATVLQTALKL